jgi:hypothetical protein
MFHKAGELNAYAYQNQRQPSAAARHRRISTCHDGNRRAAGRRCHRQCIGSDRLGSLCRTGRQEDVSALWCGGWQGVHPVHARTAAAAATTRRSTRRSSNATMRKPPATMSRRFGGSAAIAKPGAPVSAASVRSRAFEPSAVPKRCLRLRPCGEHADGLRPRKSQGRKWRA